jgi:hypothetical protein
MISSVSMMKSTSFGLFILGQYLRRAVGRERALDSYETSELKVNEMTLSAWRVVIVLAKFSFARAMSHRPT